MTGKHEVRRVALRMVTARERADEMRLVDDRYIQPRRWIASATVVIAAHQRHRNAGMFFTPSCQKFHDLRRSCLRRMKKVAEKDDMSRRPGDDERIEPRQVLLRRAAGNRLSERPVGGGFPEVQVGDEERAFRRPPYRPLGKQLEGMAGPFDGADG